jgi:hypothetical protein
VWLVFELRGLCLQALYCLSHTSSSFCSGYFGDGVSNSLPGLASNLNPSNLSLPSS